MTFEGDFEVGSSEMRICNQSRGRSQSKLC